MTAIGAVGMALWDIKGKALNTPVYNLLGGESRTGVLVYGYANGRDIEETAEAVAEYKQLGYLAVRAQTGVPGPPSTCGVAKDKLFYEPAEKGLPPENVWSSEQYLLHFDISVSNFGIQEYMRHTRETDDVFPHAYYFKDGYLHPGEATGLGVDYDEKLAGTLPAGVPAGEPETGRNHFQLVITVRERDSFSNNHGI
jgi:L-alanine-DL-glutamate epimerase-like enolase superfamily enzyme